MSCLWYPNFQDECKRVSTEGQTVRSEFSKKFNDAIEVRLVSCVMCD